MIFNEEEGVGEDGGWVFACKNELMYRVLLSGKIKDRVGATVVCP